MPFRGPRGESSLVDYLRVIQVAAQPTEGDLIYALGRQVERIQIRTEQGMDYRGAAFAPYSPRGPYYFSPFRRGSRLQRQQVALHHSRFYGGERKRGSTAVKYASYAAFKAARGVSVPDLGGMEGSLLPNIMVNVGGMHRAGEASSVSLDSYPIPASYGELGIYSQPAARIAQAHNDGVPGRLPQRSFIGVSDEDGEAIQTDIAERVQARLARAIS